MSYNESLNSNSNYPLMSQSEWESAPWNQKEVPEKDFEVTCSQSLSKTVKVTTNNYIPVKTKEYDNIGGIIEDYADTSDTLWKDVYLENMHHTPQELIQLLKEVLETNLSKGIVFKSPKYTQNLIDECSGWIIDDEEFIEE